MGYRLGMATRPGPRAGLVVILRRAMWGLTVMALLLSVGHLGLVALSARTHWDLPILWFAGSGLALLLAGLLNVAMLRARSHDPMTRVVWLLANAATAGFFLLAWPLLKQPQVAVGLVAFALLALGAGSTRARVPI